MMNKVIVIFCAVLAVAHGEDNVDNYIKVNVDRYTRVLNSYDTRMDNFIIQYDGRVEAVGLRKEMLIENIVQTEESLTPLLLLSSTTRQCALKYQHLVANAKVKRQALTECELIATAKLAPLLSAATSVRDALQLNIKKYEEDSLNCDPANYSSCATALTSQANEFTQENQKHFEYELEAAECVAKANVKEVAYCYHNHQTEVERGLAKVSFLLERCFAGEDECKPCEQYSCAEAEIVGPFNRAIPNPFFGPNHNRKCLMLKMEPLVPQGVEIF